MSKQDMPDRVVVPRFRFGAFELDVSDRQLWQGSERIELNARYLDALIYLVQNQGQLVEKETLFEQVWNDVVVSDSALTQCIKEIRKQLGDDASNPTYIQTVPRHWYRFVSEVEDVSQGIVQELSSPRRPSSEEAEFIVGSDFRSQDSSTNERSAIWKTALFECGVGTIGGGFAGLIGGLFYGFSLATAEGGVGTFSTLLVLVSLTELAGVIGGFGVSAGLAASGIVAHYVPRLRTVLRIGGAMFGGLVVGTMAKLLGVDAFNLLFGHAPSGITGGKEGFVLGATLATGAFVATMIGKRIEQPRKWHAAAGAGVLCGVAGALIPLFGGRLMGGSLDLLAQSFADSRLQLDSLGPLFGELHFGLATQVTLAGIEGLLFGASVVGAITLFRRSRVGKVDPTSSGI